MSFMPSGVAAATGSILSMVTGTSGNDVGFSVPTLNDVGSMTPDTFKSFTVVHCLTLGIANNLDLRMQPISIPDDGSAFNSVTFVEVPDLGFGRVSYLRTDATYQPNFGNASRWQWFGITDFFVTGRTYQVIFA